MIPAGYMAKHVVARPDWLQADRVDDVFSVSSCISDDFAGYIPYWKHNGYWLFDSPEVIREVAQEHALDLLDTKLFFYEVYEFEYDENDKLWKSFSPELSFETQVNQPEAKKLEGYDIVTFYDHSSPECSPLSCNALASKIVTNEHCLLPSFERAKELLEDGKIGNSEPGPYRIFAVYSVQWPIQKAPGHVGADGPLGVGAEKAGSLNGFIERPLPPVGRFRRTPLNATR